MVKVAKVTESRIRQRLLQGICVLRIVFVTLLAFGGKEPLILANMNLALNYLVCSSIIGLSLIRMKRLRLSIVCCSVLELAPLLFFNIQILVLFGEASSSGLMESTAVSDVGRYLFLIKFMPVLAFWMLLILLAPKHNPGN